MTASPRSPRCSKSDWRAPACGRARSPWRLPIAGVRFSASLRALWLLLTQQPLTSFCSFKLEAPRRSSCLQSGSSVRIRVFILLVVLALCCAACRGVAVHEQFAGVAANHPPEQTPTAPQVGGEFQPAIAQLAAEGLRIKEAVEANLEAGARHLAA